MEEPPAKRMRLGHELADAASDVGSNLPFLDGGVPIDLDNLCRLWDEQPLDFKRPLVFFTVGRKAVLSSSSGTPETGSLCRQFWNWLGQPDPYSPEQIAFKMVNGRGIYMSLPNLTQFKVKFKHGPELESIITLAPKKPGNHRWLKAQTVMTSAYPATAFKTSPWSSSDETLVVIYATLNLPGETVVISPELYIDGFRSKASDSAAAPSIEEKSEEADLVHGAGRRLLCLMLDTLAWTDRVALRASGLSYRDEVSLGARARDMQADAILANLEKEILDELKVLNPNMFEQWQAKRQLRKKKIQKTPRKQKEADLKALRYEWVRIRGNQNLVAYYMRNFGFKPLEFNSFVSVRMEATPEVIREHCNANAEKDRDCNEIIVSRDAAEATLQVENLKHCKNIRTLYLFELQALPIVDSLLPVTKCVGLLGLTSMFHLRAIEELLTARALLTVQIDCLCLDRSDWSWISRLAEQEAWARLYIRSVLVLSFAAENDMYDVAIKALKPKTTAIYHAVSGVLPHYMAGKLVDHAVRVKGEAMTDVGSQLYDVAGTKINSDSFLKQ